VRTYIPEPKRTKRTWANKPQSWRAATATNRRRVRGVRSKRLQKKRSELVERSFAHVCETGGGRRSWLRGRGNVTKRYLMQVAAFNLGVVMRFLFGVGKPRVLQGAGGIVFSLMFGPLITRAWWVDWWVGRGARYTRRLQGTSQIDDRAETSPSSTGC
jgi:transposase